MCYRPESRIYATHMSYDPEKGLVTDSSNPVMLIAFSEEVQGFEDSKVQVSCCFLAPKQFCILFHPSLYFRLYKVLNEATKVELISGHKLI